MHFLYSVFVLRAFHIMCYLFLFYKQMELLLLLVIKCVCVCVCVCVWMNMYTCTHVYTYTFIYIMYRHGFSLSLSIYIYTQITYTHFMHIDRQTDCIHNINGLYLFSVIGTFQEKYIYLEYILLCAIKILLYSKYYKYK